MGVGPTGQENSRYKFMTEKTHKDGWIQSYLGKKINIFDFDTSQIHIEDIAHHLSMICRFNGAVMRPYYVSDHSIRVYKCLKETNASKIDQLWGLLHDAGEAYANDLARPQKMQPEYSEYRKIESNVLKVIAKKFNLPAEIPEIVKYYDTVLLVTEKRDLLRHPKLNWNGISKNIKPLKEVIVPYTWEECKGKFLKVFYELSK